MKIEANHELRISVLDNPNNRVCTCLKARQRRVVISRVVKRRKK
jgi:hypothetical protein